MPFSYVEIPLCLGNIQEGSTEMEEKKNFFANTPDKI
jgi:hypothetical protein